jgi:hypothetical protein
MGFDYVPLVRQNDYLQKRTLEMLLTSGGKHKAVKKNLIFFFEVEFFQKIEVKY